MSLVPLIALGALFLAFSNGANDNLKGFATVWGSATLSYRRTVMLATVATVAGGLASVLIAHGLVQQFSGKGLVPDSLAGTPEFAIAVSIGAATAVITATRVGMPISTTHALVGALVGSGLASGWTAVDLGALGSSFLLPLLLSPAVAAFLGIAAYNILKRMRPETDCACIVEGQILPASVGALSRSVAPTSFLIGTMDQCDRIPGVALKVEVSKALDRIHVISASAICFARGLNDTPKMAALLLAAGAVSPAASAPAIAFAMAVGGVLLSRRVAETMSLKISHMDHAQGVSANLVTAFLVIFASKLGLPVSTTHVTVGSISGVGVMAGTIDWPALRSVLLSWVATLPFAAAAALATAGALKLVGYQ